jgi:hypothetical protein
MSVQALFGLSILLSFAGFGLVTALFVWPRLRVRPRPDALLPLVVPHTFRFIGLSFLVPGVVSPSLPAAFAVPAAYGDLVAVLLALAASLALKTRVGWAIPLVWVFNVWGVSDFVFAFYQGFRIQIDPSTLGAAFYIPTVVVPPAMIMHALIFRLLLRDNRHSSRSR